ncbi:hypothetical protein DT603_01650 [Pseudoxanthomonas gei]|uniref:Uncharacterized protein n=1 Tax=Pseudoxanthomonas gei TaxID=1383030 RepID=A0ABX0A7P5_9GAMM|nr:hypothetical protein [Pseudoxanthomonas gei]NDK37550.1 hypothetical protein [Pseudoxanthomonas gei]
MAERIRFPGNAGNPAITGELPVNPFDPEQLRQVLLLNEAVLVSFSASPNPRAPWDWSTLSWNITMPTTVIPGVHVEVTLFGEGEQVVQPQGSRPAKPYGDTTYTLVLRTPLAARQLGKVDLAIDFGSCFELPQRIDEVREMIQAEVKRSFPSTGKVTLRDQGIEVDFGINSFVIDIPLTTDVPNWFDADIDLTVGFQVFPVDGRVGASYSFAKTTVSFGAASAILSGGCSVAVAKALEEQSDGFFDGFIGPAIARQIREKVRLGMNTALAAFNNGRTPPYKVHDFTLTESNLLVRICPVSAPPQPSDHGGVGGGEVEPAHA